MAFITLTNMITAVRDALDEPTTQEWTDAEITRWLNEGARDTTRRTECLKATTSLSFTNGTRTYDMPTNCIRTNRIEVASGSFTVTLQYREMNEMDPIWNGMATLAGIPQWWTTWGFEPTSQAIYVFPVPNASMTATAFYYRQSTDASAGGDPIEVPEGWYDMVVDYACAQALRKDADPRWADAMMMYEGKVQALYAVCHRGSDRPDLTQFQRVDPYAQQVSPAIVPIQQQPGGPGRGIGSYLTGGGTAR